MTKATTVLQNEGSFYVVRNGVDDIKSVQAAMESQNVLLCQGYVHLGKVYCLFFLIGYQVISSCEVLKVPFSWKLNREPQQLDFATNRRTTHVLVSKV